MKICIIGIGAMGTLFAGRLSREAQVTMLGSWAEQLDAINRFGLRIINLDGSESHYNVRATNRAEDIEPCDVVLIAVKSWQTKRAARQVRKILSENGIALTMQNGIGNFEILTKAIGEYRTALGGTSEGAMMISPGNIRHAGTGESFLATSPTTEVSLNSFASLMRIAGFEVQIVDNADGLLWGKLAVNAGINPLTALLQRPNGYLAENEVAQSLMIQAAEETADVAIAQEITLPYASAGQRALEVAKSTATNRSSMAQDLARGMPTEIENINGEIVRIGRLYHVPTPVTEALLHLVRTQVNGGDWRSEIDNLIPILQSQFSYIGETEKN
jgi:2-dehydropantoate 2-reductase